MAEYEQAYPLPPDSKLVGHSMFGEKSFTACALVTILEYPERAADIWSIFVLLKGPSIVTSPRICPVVSYAS